MNRHCHKLIFVLLDEFSVPNTHNVIVDVFLSKVAGSFGIFVKIFIFFRSEMTQGSQNFDHLLFRDR